MAWQQITLIVFIILDLLIVAKHDGKPRPNYNIVVTCISALIVITLLHFGGFWK